MTSVKPVPLFFAFPDGVFHYVCAECDALCCKGQGFGGNLQREMTFILKQYPALAPMVNNRQRDYVEISTPTGRCFFLGSDNLCRIETEHGSENKPGVCIIFPFNRFQKVGDTVFVLPHFMCPLRVIVPAHPGAVAGTHAALEASIRESEMLEPKYVDWYMKSPKLPEGDSPKSILARETVFRDACAAGLCHDRFGEVLASQSDDPRELGKFVKQTTRLMDWGALPRADKRDALDDILLAIASPLRATMLHVPIHRMTRILALSEFVVRRTFSIAALPPQPQAVFSLIQQSLGVFSLLARGDECVKLRNPKKTAPFGHPDLVFAAFLTKRDIASVGVMKALEKGFTHLPSAADRTVLTHYIAEEIAASN